MEMTSYLSNRRVHQSLGYHAKTHTFALTQFTSRLLTTSGLLANSFTNSHLLSDNYTLLLTHNFTITSTFTTHVGAWFRLHLPTGQMSLYIEAWG